MLWVRIQLDFALLPKQLQLWPRGLLPSAAASLWPAPPYLLALWEALGLSCIIPTPVCLRISHFSQKPWGFLWRRSLDPKVWALGACHCWGSPASGPSWGAAQQMECTDGACTLAVSVTRVTSPHFSLRVRQSLVPASLSSSWRWWFWPAPPLSHLSVFTFEPCIFAFISKKHIQVSFFFPNNSRNINLSKSATLKGVL